MSSDYQSLDFVTKEFRKIAEKLNQEQYWYTLAKNKKIPQHFLAQIELVIQKMSEENKLELTEKFSKIVKKAKKWCADYDKKFLDIIVEILGYKYLVSLGKKAQFYKTPDLIADEGKTGLEVKNIWRSDKDEEYLSKTIEDPNSIEARTVDGKVTDPNDTNPFYSKILSTIKKAVKQLEKCENKYIFINISLDCDAIIKKSEVIKNILLKIKNEMKSDGIKIVWTYNYKL